MADASNQSLRGTFIGAFTLFIIDALILNQGVIAVVTAFVWLLLGIHTLIFTKAITIRSFKLRRCLVWVTTGALVLISNWANNQLAQHRADRLVKALMSYQMKYHDYPNSLESLAPEFIARVPKAKFILTFNEFTYFYIDGTASLYYVSVPPFGRQVYSFKEHEWFFHD